MTFQATAYRMLIVTPQDVRAEQNKILEIISSWNTKYSTKMKAFLLPVMCETHGVPEMGGRPQLINKQISGDCDILIGVFWTRLGEDCGFSESRTIEEIKGFQKAGKPVLIYFSSAPVVPSSIDLKEYENLMKFMDDCLKQGLVNRYNSIIDFQEKLSTQIVSNILKIHKTPETETPVDPGETTKKESNNIISDRFCDLIERYSLNWTSEKISQPISLDGGRKILIDLTKEITNFGMPLAQIFSKEKIKDIAQIINNLKILQKHRLYLDGKSYTDFWKLGDDIFASLDAVVLSVRKGTNNLNLNKYMESILIELSEIEKKFFEPIPSDVIAKAIGLSITETTFHLSGLLKAGLISQLLSVKSNTRYILNDAGRRFIVERVNK